MNRLKKFKDLIKHPWLGNKVIKKMNNEEIEYCEKFIIENNELSINEYEKKINRMFLDKPEYREKFKNWKYIMEALTCSK